MRVKLFLSQVTLKCRWVIIFGVNSMCTYFRNFEEVLNLLHPYDRDCHKFLSNLDESMFNKMYSSESESLSNYLEVMKYLLINHEKFYPTNQVEISRHGLIRFLITGILSKNFVKNFVKNFNCQPMVHILNC